MSRHWMPLYIGDYLRDTRRLSTLEHGAYLLLIMEYWTVGSLPTDDRQLARIAGLSIGEWTDIQPIIKTFFTDDWKHARIDRELAEAEANFEKRSAAAKAAVAAREAKKANRSSHGYRDDDRSDDPIDIHSPSPSPSSLRSESSHPSDVRSAQEPVAENLGDTATPSRPAKPTRAKVRSQIAEDAQPDERQRADAAEAGLTGDPFRTEWRKFRDHHRAKGSLMADWQAAWRTWLGNLRGFQPRAGPPVTTPPKRNAYFAAARAALEAQHGQATDSSSEDFSDRSPSAFEPSLEDRDGAIDEIVAH